MKISPTPSITSSIYLSIYYVRYKYLRKPGYGDRDLNCKILWVSEYLSFVKLSNLNSILIPALCLLQMVFKAVQSSFGRLRSLSLLYLGRLPPLRPESNHSPRSQNDEVITKLLQQKKGGKSFIHKNTFHSIIVDKSGFYFIIIVQFSHGRYLHQD